ncbi:hypothetical protein B0H10DRAFT_2240891 [Mycena sp. CBHHK59/15]|nr:hypothetical protein B0H10DRAFT_2240891 [Mycena sp. CBHHK59/15]
MDIRGGAVGTITVVEGSPGATKMKYEVTIRTDNKALLDDIILDATPDQDMFIPPNLKKIHLASHTVAHVQFDPESHIQLEDFFVTLFSSNTNNMILPHNNLRSIKMSLEVYRGWIVGDVSIDKTTTITTQRGDGVMNTLLPAASVSPYNRGAGRTDVFYVNDQSPVHRPIESVHMSSMNADMYLTYREAHYTGLVELAAHSYTLWPAKVHCCGRQRQVDALVRRGERQGYAPHKSRGWVGAYF